MRQQMNSHEMKDHMAYKYISNTGTPMISDMYLFEKMKTVPLKKLVKVYKKKGKLIVEKKSEKLYLEAEKDLRNYNRMQQEVLSYFPTEREELNAYVREKQKTEPVFLNPDEFQDEKTPIKEPEQIYDAKEEDRPKKRPKKKDKRKRKIPPPKDYGFSARDKRIINYAFEQGKSPEEISADLDGKYSSKKILFYGKREGFIEDNGNGKNHIPIAEKHMGTIDEFLREGETPSDIVSLFTDKQGKELYTWQSIAARKRKLNEASGFDGVLEAAG